MKGGVGTLLHRAVQRAVFLSNYFGFPTYLKNYPAPQSLLSKSIIFTINNFLHLRILSTSVQWERSIHF